jgi:hypothetical protein
MNMGARLRFTKFKPTTNPADVGAGLKPAPPIKSGLSYSPVAFRHVGIMIW